MGYNLYIARDERGFEFGGEGGISLQEWKDYLASDPEMRLDGFAEFISQDGWALRQEGEGIAVWTAYSGHGKNGNMAWFSHDDGCVVVKNPDEEILAKMFDIAVALGAKLLGEEGERYGRDGAILSRPIPLDAVSDGTGSEASGRGRAQVSSHTEAGSTEDRLEVDPREGSRKYFVFRNLEHDTLRISPRGWCWPAFLFGPLYLLHAKLFRVFGLYFVATFGIRIFAHSIFPKPAYHLIMAVVTLVAHLFLGDRTNKFLRDRIAAEEPQIGRIRADDEGEALHKAQALFG